MLDPTHAAAVAEAFGLRGAALLEGPVAAGRQGRIWRLTAGGERLAVKDTALALDADRVEREAAYQDRVRAAGVPVPAVVRTVEGRVLADVGGPVRAYAWVDLLPPERRLDPAEVGELVARIHRVVVPTDEAVEGWYAAPIGASAWGSLLARLRAAGAPFAERLAEVLPGVLAVEASYAVASDRQVCHRDLWADNVLRAADGGLVVLDWENCGPGSPSQELAVPLLEFGLGDPGRMRALSSAYAAAGGPGRLRGPGDLTMLLAQSAHIAQNGCERWLAATTDEDRADNAAWVGEFLDEPSSPALVASILDAVG
ncbi:phosphotransferase [Nocardioides sp. KIGAM211]|uniref:Phosphotransferase n=1 Tax=Nocardioides luti TaxID=2761101 RepID=A0A7X0VA61_9ACTN|nr:phosphotransferase [Nocardioides luti]MBB6626667.1 phosphotransferase [Nocardioides luti]